MLINNNKQLLEYIKVIKFIIFSKGRYKYTFTNNIYIKKNEYCKHLITSLIKSNKITLYNCKYRIRKGVRYITTFNTDHSITNKVLLEKSEFTLEEIHYKVNKKKLICKSNIEDFINNIDKNSDSNMRDESLYELGSNNTFINKNSLLKFLKKKSSILEKPIYTIKENILINYNGVYSNPLVICNDNVETIYNLQDYVNTYSPFISNKYIYDKNKLLDSKKEIERSITNAKDQICNAINYINILQDKYKYSNYKSYDKFDLYLKKDFINSNYKGTIFLLIIDINILLNKRVDRFVINIHNGIHKCNIVKKNNSYLVKTAKSELILSDLKNLDPAVSLHKTKKGANSKLRSSLDNIEKSLTTILDKLNNRE